MNQELRDIMAYDEAHYFGVEEDIVLGGVITERAEGAKPIEKEKQYIHEKSKRETVTGFKNEFPITMDMVKGDRVYDDFYGLWYRRETGNALLRDHYIVNL